MNILWSNPEDRESPIKFGFTPELREELKKERTPEELLQLALDCDLEEELRIATFTNDIGFEVNVFDGKVKKQDGVYFYDGEMEFEDGIKRPFRINMLDAADDISEDYLDSLEYSILHPDRTKVFWITLGERSQVHIIGGPNRLTEEDAREEISQAAIKELIVFSGIKTARELGRFLNKCLRLYAKWIDEYGEES